MKKGMLKKIVITLCVSAMAIGMIGCGANTTEKANDKTSKSALGTIKSKGKLVVGTSADYPPYEFHKETNGKDEVVGFDIDIAKEVAKDLGVELEVKDMEFDGLLIALNESKVDMIFAGLTPTEERKQNVDFSDIYYTAKHSFIMRKGEEASINSIDNLKGKKIGVQKASLQEGIAKTNFDEANIKSLGKVTDLVLDLKNNKVDAILVESLVAKFNCDKNEGIAVAPVVVEDKDGGSAIALRKGSDDLKTEVNKTIKRLNDNKKIDEFVVEANKLVD